MLKRQTAVSAAVGAITFFLATAQSQQIEFLPSSFSPDHCRYDVDNAPCHLCITQSTRLGCAGLPDAAQRESGQHGEDKSGPMKKSLMNWSDLKALPQPQPNHTVSYGGHPLQVVDVWQPDGATLADPAPSVIMIHGGCWQTEIAERDLMNWIAADLRGHGVGVWNIEYRGVDRDGGYPQTYLDVGKAADLFHERGTEFGLRTDKVVVIGHSAGGHLTLWLANRSALPESSAIRGLDPIEVDIAISQGGLPDLRAAAKRDGHPCGTSAPQAMSDPGLSETSPPEMPTGAARQVLFHNSRDQIAPPDFARKYQQKMTARGVKVELVETPNEGHVELVAPSGRSWGKQRSFILKQWGMSDGH